MTHVPTSLHDEPPGPAPTDEHLAGTGYASEDRLEQRSDADHPRLIEERHIVGPHGEDELEA